MRKFRTAIIFLVIVAVTVVVIGLFSRNKLKTESSSAEPAQQTETFHRILLI